MKGLYIKRPSLDIGESIEEKIRKARAEKAPIESIAPMVYTAKKDGVLPQYDIRTDRQEIALDAVDHYHASEAFKSAEAAEEQEQTNTEE